MKLALLLVLASGAARADMLVPAWELAGLRQPESVVYDPAQKVLYVSNIDGDTTAKDGNGFIARVGTDGTMLQAAWVTGLDAPKGLAVAGDRLYVADIDTLVEVDIPGARVAARHVAPEGKFFNDVTVAADGSVYVSDTATNRIYRLQNGALSVWLESPQLDGPNGLLAEPGRLLVGSWGSEAGENMHGGQLLAVSLVDQAITSASAGTGVGQLDGIEARLGGGYYLTDWYAGTLLRADGDGKVSTLKTFTRGLADLEVLTAEHLLLLPRMLDGKLEAWRVAP